MCFIFRTIFYNDGITLRELSTITNCSLSKTSRLIQELEKKDLINIEVKGRNYLISPNIKNDLAYFKLYEEEVMYTKEILSFYPDLFNIIKKIEGNIMLLFGSYASKEARKDSDVDILVIRNNPSTSRKKEIIEMDISQFKQKLSSSHPTVLSIIKKHAIIKGFEEFLNLVMEWKKKSYYGV